MLCRCIFPLGPGKKSFVGVFIGFLTSAHFDPTRESWSKQLRGAVVSSNISPERLERQCGPSNDHKESTIKLGTCWETHVTSTMIR